MHLVIEAYFLKAIFMIIQRYQIFIYVKKIYRVICFHTIRVKDIRIISRNNFNSVERRISCLCVLTKNNCC